MPPCFLEEMQQVTAQLIDQARHIASNNEIYDLDGEHSADNPLLNRIKRSHEVHDVFRRYMQSDALLDLIKPLPSDSIRLHNSKLNTKAAQGGSAVHHPTNPLVDLNRAQTLTGKAGDISLQHVRTLHGSATNNGDDPRYCYSMLWLPTMPGL